MRVLEFNDATAKNFTSLVRESLTFCRRKQRDYTEIYIQIKLRSVYTSTKSSFQSSLLQSVMARTKQSARKRKSSDYAADNEFVENDSDGADRPTKRTKPTTSSSPRTRPHPQTDSDGNIFWEISKMRRVTISEFKGKQMVSVREYYEQDGEVKPGKKVYNECDDQNV